MSIPCLLMVSVSAIAIFAARTASQRNTDPISPMTTFSYNTAKASRIRRDPDGKRTYGSNASGEKLTGSAMSKSTTSTPTPSLRRFGSRQIAEAYGLRLVAKNVALLGDGAATILAHPNVIACIVEQDDVTAAKMQALRVAAGKPVLPIRFVTFGADQRAWVQAIAREITAAGYADMGVTWSEREYDTSEPILDPLKAPDMAWREAKSLLKLRDQVNAAHPDRDKRNDGTIGDPAHQARISDHNPDGEGVVRAIDITHDPAHGVDSYKLAETLRLNRDPRIKYVISNHRIFSASNTPWTWRPYSGSNPHTEHVHVSVVADDKRADDERPWVIDGGTPIIVPDGSIFQSGRASWYSQFSGKYEWRDSGDKPGSAALGVPDDAQGISFFNHATLGKWYEVHAPNGAVSIEQQTDIGPSPNTGRTIDISSAAAERFGYSPNNFPTDTTFSWRPIDPPQVVASLSPQQQAMRYRDMRSSIVIAPPQPKPPPEVTPPVTVMSNNSLLFLIIANLLEKHMTNATPGGGSDIASKFLTDLPKLLAFMRDPVLQKLMSGGAVTLAELLTLPRELLALLTGQATTLPQLPAPDKPVVEPKPVSPVVVAPTTPVYKTPSVQLSAGGLGASLIAMATGLLGTPFGLGDVPTSNGTLATVIPIVTGLIGATGGWGSLASIAMKLIGGFASAAGSGNKQK